MSCFISCSYPVTFLSCIWPYHLLHVNKTNSYNVKLVITDQWAVFSHPIIIDFEMLCKNVIQKSLKERNIYID